MNKLQEKLDFLLEKYAVKNKAVLAEDNQSVSVDGKEYKLLPWRNERRYIELKKIVDSNTVGILSHFKIMSLNPNSACLNDVIKREIDVAEYISGATITEVFMAKNGGTCSVICMTDKKAVFTLELGATLKSGAEVIDKHELITDRGTACDRVIDSQTPLYSVYVYGEENKEFIDVDFELYGLSIYEISVVRQAFDVAKDVALGEKFNQIDGRLNDILKKAEYSETKCENVCL